MLSLIGKSIKVVHFQYRYIVYILKADSSFTHVWMNILVWTFQKKSNKTINQVLFLIPHLLGVCNAIKFHQWFLYL